MTKDSSFWRWGFLAFAATLGVFFAAVLDDRVMIGLGVFKMDRIFADWLAILSAGDAARAGLDPYLPNPLDRYAREHVYGPWWLGLAWLGFDRGDRLWMGALLVLGFLVAAIAILRPRSGWAALVVVGLLCSGPIMLGMERANNDLAMMLLLGLAGWAAARGRLGLAVGAGAVVLAAALKIYPIAALPALFVARERRWAWWAVIATSLACLLVALYWLEDYRRVMAVAPQPISIFTYGFGNIIYIVQHLNHYAAQLVLGFAPVLALAGWLLWRARAGLWRLVPEQGGRAGVYVAGACSWLFCYLATTSFPYRAVLLLLCAGLWLREAGAEQRGQGRPSAVMLGLFGFALWCSAPKRFLGAWSEQSGAQDPVAVGWLMVNIGVEQALMVALGVGLSATLVGWAWRKRLWSVGGAGA